MLDVRIDDGLRHMDWIEQQLAETHRLETEAAWAGKVSLNRELYRAVAAAGNLLSAGAFVDGELVGYCSAFLSRHPHYDCLMCQHDALFLLPEYRVGMAGLRLVQTTEREAERRGAAYVAWHAKPGSSFEGILARRCRREDVVYLRQLRKDRDDASSTSNRRCSSGSGNQLFDLLRRACGEETKPSASTGGKAGKGAGFASGARFQ